MKPSEKSKMMIATISDENSVGFSCKGGNPLEKIKALCRTPDERPDGSCFQFISKVMAHLRRTNPVQLRGARR